MKRKFFSAILAVSALTFTVGLSACSDDDKDEGTYISCEQAGPIWLDQDFMTLLQIQALTCSQRPEYAIELSECQQKRDEPCMFGVLEPCLKENDDLKSTFQKLCGNGDYETCANHYEDECGDIF